MSYPWKCSRSSWMDLGQLDFFIGFSPLKLEQNVRDCDFGSKTKHFKQKTIEKNKGMKQEF